MSLAPSTTDPAEVAAAIDAIERHPGGRFFAYVWDCGDEYCNCTEAKIQYRWKDYPGSLGFHSVEVWHGEFYTDSEGWAPGGSTTELNRLARKLRRHHHDQYAQVEWPWNRSEG